MTSKFDLKEYLLSDFSNNKYKKISLIELYASDYKYYQMLLKKNLIEDDAVAFFNRKRKKIFGASKIANEEYRLFEYKMIIDQYFKELPAHSKDSGEEVNRNNEDYSEDVKVPLGVSCSEGSNEPAKDYSDYFVELRCLNDDTLLQLENVKEATLKSSGEKIIFPLYRCPKCRRGYTSISNCKDQQLIRHQEESIHNLLPEENRRRHQTRMQNQQIVVQRNSWRNEVKLRVHVYPKNMPGECKHCHYQDFLQTQVYFLTKNGKISGYPITVCKVCKTCYIKTTFYNQHKDDWETVATSIDTEAETSSRVKAITPVATSKTTSVMQPMVKSAGQVRKLSEKEKRSEAKKKAAEIIARVREEKRKEEGIDTTGEKRPLETKQNIVVNSYQSKTHQQTSSGGESDQKRTVRIAVKDFVVRRSVFRCRKEDHVLQNIDAVVTIIDTYGHLKEMRVPAGYCKSCNMYFIMESNYQYLKMRGTLVCRVSDEKSYLSGKTYMNGMQLAQESVLMQYGYNVSKGSNLTTASRRRLLELLVDNRVMTRSEIISYLDFFIRQRKTRKQYEDAIDKWSSDRDYISNYRTGDYRQVRIGGITRR